MTDQRTPTPDRPEAGRYEIRLTGHLDAHWAAWFDGLTVSREGDGTTLISGPIVDQAALHGVLQRIRDLGLRLVSVSRIEPDQPATTGIDAGSNHL
jgi:hypothetical protein